MSKNKALYFSTEVIGYPLLFVMLMWVFFWAEIRFGWNLNFLGIYPQKIEGLQGIVLGPFIHSSLKHLFNNSVPMLVLTTALFYFYRSIRWKVLLLGLLFTGILTWLIGRPALHIGASGVVYMLAAFLCFKGIFSKQYQLTALAFVVVFLYGSLLWYLFPIDPKISWEGHLSGFVVGLLFAFIFRSNPIENKKYIWEQEDYEPDNDPFLKHFDEDGNFIEKLPETETTEEIPKVRITYTYKKEGLNEDENTL
ncbi:membrane associated rhomboid family serine protease [Ulvibacter sp. MAR_2010_11]|uniref:rhomboid family intramembrane serine protease n=1 Tax=Ulvibacter sp. MAR_2010_11 TaxID=1250229 RepID=UPI000C2CB8FC|nr:rhomboid family intramembrane serine protease [Ulvibacter sp. MAR_2010_11]PKA83460.1 membrane associated rhomboid family serine protease [Ulvibacter sp. MAR_2010_11]